MKASTLQFNNRVRFQFFVCLFIAELIMERRVNSHLVEYQIVYLTWFSCALKATPVPYESARANSTG